MPAVVIQDEPSPLLDAFRKQVRAVLLAWEGQRGVSRDDLIDIVKEELGLIPPRPEEPRRGSVQPSPFG